jgi:hypothetical protein
MTVVDIAAQGQVTGGALKYTLSNVVSGVERVEVLGYSIRRSEPNVNEGNNMLDFKYGATSISALRVVRAGYGYDPDNPPRTDSTETSPSLGVEVYSVLASGARQNVAVPDYVEMTIGAQKATLVRSSKSPQLGARAECIVAEPYRYAYRFYVCTAAYLAQKTVSAQPVAADDMATVHFEIAPSVFGTGDAARARILATVNEACARAAAPRNAQPLAAPRLKLEYSSAGTFQFVSTTNAPFVVFDADRLAYVLCGRSPRRHATHPYERRAMRTSTKSVAGDPAVPGVVVVAYAHRSAMLDEGTQTCRFEGDGAHDARLAMIRDELVLSSAISAEVDTGRVLTARLRAGNYPIGSVLHAPYPVVLNVDESVDDDEWRAVQRELGAYPTKAYGLSRRQAADGLIKEVQDAMNFAIHEAEYAQCARVDPSSLPDMFAHVTHDPDERREPAPHVYDLNVPFLDNPAFLCRETETAALGFQYEPGRQSRASDRRRKQSVFVTLEDEGGDVHTADDEPFSREGLGWNGYRATRVRISTRENRVGDVRADGSTIRADSERETRTGVDRGARKADPALQNITLLFATGPNSARSIHRALGFMDADYTQPQTFVVRRPALAPARAESAAEESDLVADAEDATDGIHVVLRPDAAIDEVLVGGHEYWRESDDASIAAASAKYAASGHVRYTRYVPVDAVTEASTTHAVPSSTVRDVDFRYRGGRRHFVYYEVLGYQAPHAYNMDTDPLILSVSVEVNDKRHADAERVQTPSTQSGFALLPIGGTDHVEPRTMHDGSAYQHAMLNYKLSGYVTAQHATGVDRALSGFRNFGRVAPNAQDPSGRRWAATAQEASNNAGRDSVFGSRHVHMLKAGDFGSKMLTLDDPVTAHSLTFRFSRLDSTVPYSFGAQEVTMLVRLHVANDRTNFRR